MSWGGTIDGGFDAEDGTVGGGLEFAEEAGAEKGVELGADGGGVEGDGEGALGEVKDAGVLEEVGGDGGVEEVGEAVEFGSGFGNDGFEPGEEDVAEAGGVAGAGVGFIGEELLEGEELVFGGEGFEVLDEGIGFGRGGALGFGGGFVGSGGHGALAVGIMTSGNRVIGVWTLFSRAGVGDSSAAVFTGARGCKIITSWTGDYEVRGFYVSVGWARGRYLRRRARRFWKSGGGGASR